MVKRGRKRLIFAAPAVHLTVYSVVGGDLIGEHATRAMPVKMRAKSEGPM